MKPGGPPNKSYILVLIALVLNLLIGIYSVVLHFTNKDELVYVDSVRVLNNYKGMETARKELNSKSETWKANLDTLRSEVEGTIASYEKTKLTLSVREKKLMEELIEVKQQQFLNYEQVVKSEFQKTDQEMTAKVLSNVNDYIKRYGSERGYTIILAATQYGNIVYAEKSLDITEEVLKGLNEEYEKIK